MVYVPEAIEKSTYSVATKAIEAVFHVSIHIKYVSLLGMNMMQASGVHVDVQKMLLHLQKGGSLIVIELKNILPGLFRSLFLLS